MITHQVQVQVSQSVSMWASQWASPSVYEALSESVR